MNAGLQDALLARHAIDHAFGTRTSEAFAPLARPQQVHGVRVVTARGAGGPETLGEADAVVTTTPGLAVAVVTADCVPLLAAGASGRAVAAIHAGWRGLAAGVVERGIDALRAITADEPLRVAIGPHIAGCCYEVDAPVTSALRARFGIDALRQATRPSQPDRVGHEMLDLGALVALELARAGIPLASVSSDTAACTRCDALRFHSYRRDGAASGRLVHCIRAASRSGA